MYAEMGAEPMGGQPAQHMVDKKTRPVQLDSSLRRKRQLPVPQYPPQTQQSSAKHQPGIKKLSSN